MRPRRPPAAPRPPAPWSDWLSTLVIALAVTGGYHFLYYRLAPWIWSRNLRFAPDEITPWIAAWAGERDGVETFALYLLVIAVALTTLVFSGLARRARRVVPRAAVLIVALIGAAILSARIGFTPPMSEGAGSTAPPAPLLALSLLAGIFAIVGALHGLWQRWPRWGTAATAIVVTPACLIGTAPVSGFDYQYVFAPALRLLNGAGLGHIYFQYDLLLSLLAAGWMKLGLDLNAFQLLPRVAYVATIVGLFLLARRWFARPSLAFLLVAALVIGRMYASPYEPAALIQVTPLRLDLWLLVVVAAYALGPYHWAVGALCGALIVVHNKFGIIYSLAYLELLATLGALRWLDRVPGTTAREALRRHLSDCAAPLAGIAVFATISLLMSRGSDHPHYSDYYQKIGIGFLPIARQSFYWFVPALVGTTVVALVRLRRTLPATQTASALLVVFCAIGNSIYFFGRSHENNILNLALILLFLLFIGLDLIDRSLPTSRPANAKPSLTRRYGVAAAAGVAIAAMVFAYSSNIATRLEHQYVTIRHGRLIESVPQREQVLEALEPIKAMTRNSSKLYFIDREDFPYYYYGGYPPVGFCNPFTTWIFRRDLNAFLQQLIDQGYFLVCNRELAGVLQPLTFREGAPAGRLIVVSNTPLRVDAAQRIVPEGAGR